MLRLILILLLLVLVAISASVGILFHFFGWKGLLGLPVILLLVVWLGKVLVVGLFKRFAMGLFSMKSGVLRGATMTVHSIEPGMKPESAGESEVQEVEGEMVADDQEEKVPRHYVDVDLTITPKESGRAGVWEPTELMLTRKLIKSLSEIEDDSVEVGIVEQVLVWNGEEFGPDDPGKYEGPQRLRVTFAVRHGVSKVWLHYYNEPIGELKLPPAPIEV